ncbi:MAG: SDR family oxidoreductase [Candidatus Dormibacteraeota bacterium]|nr:SDR family oxidoreductase [Candidatus Dormibacteraeota bacterium]
MNGIITGGSRGIGAAIVLELADRGHGSLFTYVSRVRRAAAVERAAREMGVPAAATRCDLTEAADLSALAATAAEWGRDAFHLLFLNASGGLEKDRLAADPHYPMAINRDAQLECVDALLPRLTRPATVVYLTSHWAHLHGRIPQLPIYEPIAASKQAGETALREHLRAHPEVRLLIVTADMVEGAVTPLLLERAGRGSTDRRRRQSGALPSAGDVARAAVAAALDETLPNGHVTVVGAPLETLLAGER